MKRIRLKEYAQALTISTQTARRWYHEGRIPHPTHRISERVILVEVPDDFLEQSHAPSDTQTVAYCRVSTQSQKDGLTHQKASIYEYANNQGIIIDKCVEEIGSGFNENRKKLKNILANPNYGRIIVEHRDRLARSNFSLIEQALHAQGREIIVVKNDDLDDDLVKEITDHMVSVCGRIYGKRGAQRLKEQLNKDHDHG